MTPHREMQLWVESANPDYQKAVEERLAELRAKGKDCFRLFRERRLNQCCELIHLKRRAIYRIQRSGTVTSGREIDDRTGASREEGD